VTPHNFVLAQRDLEGAFEQLEALFLGMVNVQRRAASGRDDSFHDEIGSVVWAPVKFVGTAPSTIVLLPGDHKIEMKASKFVDWKRTISVRDGSDLNVKATMQRQ
jgi:hypothetical protein